VPLHQLEEKWEAHWKGVGHVWLADHERHISEIDSASPSSGGTGRPGKREALAEVYRAKVPKGNRGRSWNEALRVFELEYGISGSVETLKRGIKD
jgi:hypothetical protein